MQSTDSWLDMMEGWKAEGFEPPSDMDSAPMAMPTSMLPVAIWAAISWTALRPEEQKRLTEEAAEVLGRPAAREGGARDVGGFGVVDLGERVVSQRLFVVDESDLEIEQ